MSLKASTRNILLHLKAFSSTSYCRTTADIFYDEEQKMMQSTLRRIILEDIDPYVDQWEKEGMYPAHKIMKKLGSAGLLGVNKPTEFGGLGLNLKYNVALNETLGESLCGGIPMSIAVQTDMATPALARFGSDKLRKEFLTPSIAGDMVACLGISEPSAGSDVASLTTFAKRVGEDLVINGQKMWITNAFCADWMCLLANVKGGTGHDNKSLIVVPMKTPGINLAKKIKKMGMLSSDTGLIYFEDVRVPASYIIGEDGMGFTYQMLQFQEERLACGALSLAPLEKCINETIEYTKQRKVFGAPLLNNQYLYFRLAEMKTEVEMLRAALYRATDAHIAGHNVLQLASMIKLKSGRLVRAVSDGCLQFWGGMGYCNDVIINRLFRDLRLISIGGGADEVMLSIIAKTMGILPKSSRTK